jgi:hypothetical protein
VTQPAAAPSQHAITHNTALPVARDVSSCGSS